MLLFKRFYASKRRLSPSNQLEKLYKLTQAVNETRSTFDKHEILLKYPACHSILKRIYHPHLSLFISSKSVQAYIETTTTTTTTTDANQQLQLQSNIDSLEQLLDMLAAREITGKNAKEAVAAFYKTYCKTPESQAIFWKVIDRNLKMGVSTKTVRDILSNKTDQGKKLEKPFMNIALSKSWTGKNTPDFSVEDWYVSQKLDGVRCITIVKKREKEEEEGEKNKDDEEKRRQVEKKKKTSKQGKYDIQFYSRTGRQFTTLEKVKEDIERRIEAVTAKTKKKEMDDFVLDGEVCAYENDDNKNEVFVKAMSQVRRVNSQMEKPVYQVFDRIGLHHFIQGKGVLSFSERQKKLLNFIGEDQHFLKMVPQTKVTSLKQLEKLQLSAIQNGWEGLIIRKDVPYEGKRTKDMLKIKEWEDAEYTVEGIETGLMRMPDTGENKLVMTSVNIKHKGNPVSVGSGFSIDNRIRFANDPKLIIGKQITVRYFSESETEGRVSLRFPSVKAIYEDGKRDV